MIRRYFRRIFVVQACEIGVTFKACGLIHFILLGLHVQPSALLQRISKRLLENPAVRGSKKVRIKRLKGFLLYSSSWVEDEEAGSCMGQPAGTGRSRQAGRAGSA